MQETEVNPPCIKWQKQRKIHTDQGIDKEANHALNAQFSWTSSSASFQVIQRPVKDEHWH